MTGVHAACDNAGKKVTCDRCGRTYVCSPSDDYYCTPDGRHSCESCLIGGLQLITVDVDTVGLEDLVATCRNCRLSITRRPGEKYWADASGWEFCPRPGESGLHEPVPAGQAGAPLEVPGIPDEPEPRLWGG